jgi:hypothetical protein
MPVCGEDDGARVEDRVAGRARAELSDERYIERTAL